MSLHDRIRRFGGLINVYRRREERLARILQDARAVAERERAQLQNIEAIGTDYRHQLAEAMRQGTTAQRLKNWQRFVRNLDAVHTEQVERSRRADGASDEHRDAWISQHRRVKGFETLAERLETERDAQQRRSEQRALDEIASRRRDE